MNSAYITTGAEYVSQKSGGAAWPAWSRPTDGGAAWPQWSMPNKGGGSY